jgi:hypothetical protein
MHKVRQETSVLKMLMQNTMGEFYLGGRSKYLLQMLFFSFLFVFCFFCFFFVLNFFFGAGEVWLFERVLLYMHYLWSPSYFC